MYTGDVISDINMKRGKVKNMGNKQNKEVVEAEVPLAEMFGYSTDLRSKSQGRASFTMNFSEHPNHSEPNPELYGTHNNFKVC